MKKWYYALFCAPKQEKVKETVILARGALSVAVVVLCLAAMSLTAYAYFAKNVTSTLNAIRAAEFQTQIQVQQLDRNGQVVDTLSVTPSGDVKYVQLQANVPYKVTVAPSQSATADTGFVVVKAENCPTVGHTQQLGTDTNANGGYTASVSFILQVGEATTVSFLDHWGTSSSYPGYQDPVRLYITQQAQIQLTVNGVEVSEEEPSQKEESQQDETQQTPDDETPAPDQSLTETPDTPADTQQPSEETTVESTEEQVS